MPLIIINTLITKWNGLSFTIPEMDIPGIGKAGGQTIGMPQVSQLGYVPTEGLATTATQNIGTALNQVSIVIEDARDPEAVVQELERILNFKGVTL